MIGITTDGIVCGRLGRRLPEAERWDQTGWQDLKGVPWDLRPTGRSMLRLRQTQPRQSEENEGGKGHERDQNQSGREMQRTKEECERNESDSKIHLQKTLEGENSM